MKFRNLFREVPTLDPITRSFTLASIAMETFTALFLDVFELANTPVEGYYKKCKNYSISGSCWIDCLEYKNKIKLSREYRIGKYWVDGFDVNTNTVYEYFGCYFHGCLCQNNIDRNEQKINSRGESFSLNDKYTQTLTRLDFFQKTN